MQMMGSMRTLRRCCIVAVTRYRLRAFHVRLGTGDNFRVVFDEWNREEDLKWNMRG
jgi:hypothetical protein